MCGPGVTGSVLKADNEVMEDDRPRSNPTTSLRSSVVAALAGPALVTLLAIPQRHPPTAVIAVLYVLAVVVAARTGGAIGGLGASVLSFLSLNFFFTAPLHTFAVGTLEDLVALLVFLIVAVIVGVLLSSAVTAKSQAERRELEARLINRLAARLLSGESMEKVLTSFADGICDLFGLSQCEISTAFTDGAVVSRGRDESLRAPREVPLVVRGENIGQIRIWLGSRDRLTEDETLVIESLATQLALAMEGTRLSLEVRRVELEVHASRLKAALFAGVTHDVKTPLASIMAAVTSLIDGRDFSEQDRRDHLDTIKQEAERLHRVVNNLLDVARLRAGALQPKKVLSSIDELAESVINRLRPLLGSRAVDLRFGEDIPEVPVDVVQIDQVLSNLIENAIKFTPLDTPISLLMVGHRQGVRITVSDCGPGVPKEDRVRIFEPFEKLAGTNSGTGLGLAIAHAIVVAHGGRMWLSESPTGGAAFTFELPCAVDSPPEAVSDAGKGTRS